MSNQKPTLKRAIAGALRIAHFLGLPEKKAKAPAPKAATLQALRPARSAGVRTSSHLRSMHGSAPAAPLATTKAGRVSNAATRERARCRAIVMHGLQLGLMQQAQAYAFGTDLTESQAVKLLNAASADGGQRGRLAERMAEVKTPNIGPGDGMAAPDMTTPRGAALAIVAAAEKARGTGPRG